MYIHTCNRINVRLLNLLCGSFITGLDQSVLVDDSYVALRLPWDHPSRWLSASGKSHVWPAQLGVEFLRINSSTFQVKWLRAQRQLRGGQHRIVGCLMKTPNFMKYIQKRLFLKKCFNGFSRLCACDIAEEANPLDFHMDGVLIRRSFRERGCGDALRCLDVQRSTSTWHLWEKGLDDLGYIHDSWFMRMK